MNENGRLILNDTTFSLSEDESKFYVFESDEHEDTLTIAFDAAFQAANYGEERITPSLVINEHETGKATIAELFGQRYHVDDVETMTKREDTLYIYEHEPMVRYAFTIVELAEDKVHIQIEGIAIVDGYAKPYTTAPFNGDFWLRCTE